MRGLSRCYSLISRSLFAPFTSRPQAQSDDTLPMLLILRGHMDTVSHAAYSPDGTRVVTTSWDRTAKVWSAVNG